MEPSSITIASDAVKAEFDRIADWSERTKHLLALGRALPDADPSHLTEANRVVGCQSRVWIYESASSTPDALTFAAYSDSLLMRGVIAIALRIYNGASCDEIIRRDADALMRIGLDSYLAPGRSNGLHLLVKRMQHLAKAHLEITGDG